MRKPRPAQYNPAQALHLIASDRSRAPLSCPSCSGPIERTTRDPGGIYARIVYTSKSTDVVPIVMVVFDEFQDVLSAGPTLDGLPGNDDLGGLSAFHVFSSLGFGPVTPGAPLHVVGSPAFAFKRSFQLGVFGSDPFPLGDLVVESFLEPF